MNDLALFEIWMRRQGKRIQTINTHLCNIKKVLRDVNPLTRENVELYALKLLNMGHEETYINHILDAVSLYGQCIGKEELRGIKRFKEKETHKATLSDKEIEELINMPCPEKGEKRAKEWKRWNLFFTIATYTGMRPGEVAELTINSIDFGRNVFFLRAEDVKTGQARFVPIHPVLLEPLKEYVTNLTSKYLFPSKRGGTNGKGVAVFTEGMWDYNIKKRLGVMGIKREKLSAHSLRHSFVARMLDEDVSLKKVQQIVGHKQIETTAHYYHLTTKNIVMAIKKDPLGRKAIDPRELIRAVEEEILRFDIEKDNRFDYVKVRNIINTFVTGLYEAIKVPPDVQKA